MHVLIPFFSEKSKFRNTIRVSNSLGILKKSLEILEYQTVRTFCQA